MSMRKGLLAGAVCMMSMGLAGQADAKIYGDNGWLVDGDSKHEILTVYSSSCNWDELEFGTNGGLVPVDKFRTCRSVEGFILAAGELAPRQRTALAR